MIMIEFVLSERFKGSIDRILTFFKQIYMEYISKDEKMDFPVQSNPLLQTFRDILEKPCKTAKKGLDNVFNPIILAIKW